MDAKEKRLRDYSETFGWVVRTVYEIAEEAGWCEPDDLNVFDAKQLVELRAWLRAEGYGPVAAVLDDRWRDLQEFQEMARAETVHEVELENRRMRRIFKMPRHAGISPNTSPKPHSVIDRTWQHPAPARSTHRGGLPASPALLFHP